MSFNGNNHKLPCAHKALRQPTPETLKLVKLYLFNPLDIFFCRRGPGNRGEHGVHHPDLQRGELQEGRDALPGRGRSGVPELSHLHRGKYCPIKMISKRFLVKSYGSKSLGILGSAKRWSPGCVNALGKARQKW